MLEAGVELKTIQELLGHASITVTADTYTHVRLRLQHDAINQLGGTIRRTGAHDDDASRFPDNGYPSPGGWDNDEPPEPTEARIR